MINYNLALQLFYKFVMNAQKIPVHIHLHAFREYAILCVAIPPVSG